MRLSWASSSVEDGFLAPSLASAFLYWLPRKNSTGYWKKEHVWNLYEQRKRQRVGNKSSSSSEAVALFQQKLGGVEAELLPLSVRTVNSTEKKDKDMTTFIFFGIVEIKTAHLFITLLPHNEKPLSCAAALQKPEIYKNPWKEDSFFFFFPTIRLQKSKRENYF